MPSVAMRRSSRAFVPKNAEFGRVLRSGRKLLLDSGEGRHRRRRGGQSSAQNSHLLCNSVEIAGNRRRRVISEQDLVVRHRSSRRLKVTLENSIQVIENVKGRRKKDIQVTDISNGRINITSKQDVEGSTDERNGRRRVNLEVDVKVRDDSKVNSEPDVEVTDMDTQVGTSDSVGNAVGVRDCKRKECPQLEEDLMCGTFYVRKKSKTNDVDCQGGCGLKFGILGEEGNSIGGHGEALDVIVESSPSSFPRFSCFLVSVLKFMRSSRLALPGLAGLVCREPIFEVFSQNGVHFMHALSPRTSLVNDSISLGFCRIYGDQPFMPLVWLDFLAAPQLFWNLHTVVFLRSLYRSHVLLCFSVSLLHATRYVAEGRETVSCHPSRCILPQTSSIDSGNSHVKEIHTSLDVDGFEMAGTKIPTRSDVPRSIRKKRSSLSSKRVKKSSSRGFRSVQHVRANDNVNGNTSGISGSVSLDIFKTMDGGYCASTTVRSNAKATYKVKRDVCHTYEVTKPTVVRLRDGMDLQSCNANVLVIGSDRCFREEGATVSLECSTSKVWHVVVKTQGLTRYIHCVRDVMKASTTNRFTRAMIWTSADGWKLEFCDRKDWYVFKELYKECWDKNLEIGSTTTIPVPGVREVPNYDDGNHVLFSRQDSYITVRDNEVARAFKKKAIYDIDQDDEEWIAKLNSDLCSGDAVTVERLSAEKFEKMIDILEKAAYRSHGDTSDEKKLTTLCSKLGEDKVVTAVYQYWLNKRKRAAFIKVFECQPSPQAPVGEGNFLHKKIPTKKQVSQNGRRNNSFVLKPCLQNQKKKTRRKRGRPVKSK